MKVLSRKSWEKLFNLPYQTSHKQTIDLTLDTFVGNPIQVANEWAKQWVSKFEKITQEGIPPLPPLPQPKELVPGWNTFDGEWKASEPPAGTLVFDTETHGKWKQFPIFGVAVNKRAWYFWLSNWALSGSFTGELIYLDPASLVIAHNASFDAARCANQYTDHAPEWVDTMSLVQATNGITKKLSNLFAGKKKPGWFYAGTGVSLKDAVSYWVRDGSAQVTQEDKNLRTFFAECDTSPECHQRLIANWDSLVRYSFNDVQATYHLFRIILPEYLKVCPNLASLMAQSLMLRAKFPINPDFEDWIKHCDIEFQKRDNRVKEIINELKLNTTYDANCPWVTKLNWETTSRGKYAGIPNWKRDDKAITLRSHTLPYLLKLTWKGFPIQHSKEMGWHFINEAGEAIRLPHKMGQDNNVGNPLSDIYRSYIEEGTLSSAIPGFNLKEFHTLYFETTYWLGNRDRIKEVYVSKNHIHIPSIVPHRTVTRRSGDRLWLTVPDLKEGKIGTAIKSQIRIPEDLPYWLVGADFSTQELNIASLFSDWVTNQELASNDFSFMNFAGSKENKSDMHSVLASKFGIDRGSVAKPMNFAGLYNCGAGRYATILKQGTKDISNPDELAKQILQSKRGEKLPVLEPDWIIYIGLMKAGYLSKAIQLGNRFKFLPKISIGGTDSWYYNSIDARLSEEQPRTPLLDCRMPLWLEKANRAGDEFMTRSNWNIQSSGVDILCLFLVLMDWLRAKKGLNFTYVVSRHDEVWFKAHTDEVNQLAECMQIAHVSCWAALANKLGIHALPESLCLFPEINVDKVLRKEVDLDVWDGYGIKPSNGYYIKSKEFLC